MPLLSFAQMLGNHPSLRVLITSRQLEDTHLPGLTPAQQQEVQVQGLGSNAMNLLLRGLIPQPVATNAQIAELATKCQPSVAVARLVAEAINQGRLRAKVRTCCTPSWCMMHLILCV
jgi:hypothetical protein